MKPAEPGPVQLGKHKCLCTKAHETREDGASLCDSREKHWICDLECIESWRTQLHSSIYRY